MGLTAYTSKKLADHMLAQSAFTIPAGTWLGLHTASPTFAGLNTNEVSMSGTGYARLDLSGKLSAADVSTGLVLLLDTITSGVATVDWGTITHLAIYDDAIAGNMLAFTELSEAETIYSGGQFQRVPGNLQFRLF